MKLFSMIAVILSIILSLGIAALLKSFVEMFRARGYGRLHWMPLAWAGCIFIYQVQFWWAIIELQDLVHRWNLWQFLLLLLLTLLLFLASALILPEKLEREQNLLDEFHRDGQWALLILLIYAIIASVTDYLFWGARIETIDWVFLGMETMLPIINLLTRKVWLETTTTILYVLNCLISSLLLSPLSYS